jgi:hypothetical protein
MWDLKDVDRTGILGGIIVAGVGFAAAGVWGALQINHYQAVDREQKAQIEALKQDKEENSSLNEKLKASNAAVVAERAKTKQLCGAVNTAISSGRWAGSQDGIRDNCPQPDDGDGVLVVKRPRADGDKVPMVPAVTEAGGTVDVWQFIGKEIWFAVMTPGEKGYHIQGDWPSKSGPAKIAQGRWTSPALYLGGKADAGKHFDIVMILANENASSKFWDYLREGSDTHSFPEMTKLPLGAEEWNRVDVIRELCLPGALEVTIALSQPGRAGCASRCART